MAEAPPSRIDTIAPALAIGFVAFAFDPSERVLVAWTLGSWLVLTLLAVAVLALSSRRHAVPTQEAGTALHIRARLIDALASKAELLREVGRTDEALSTYDELIRKVERHSA